MINTSKATWEGLHDRQNDTGANWNSSLHQGGQASHSLSQATPTIPVDPFFWGPHLTERQTPKIRTFQLFKRRKVK